MIGGLYYINGNGVIGIHTIVEFVMYVNMLTFPVSAIGLTASMIQRAAASQRRINEFLETKPCINKGTSAEEFGIEGDLLFNQVSFTYPETGVRALNNVTFQVAAGERVLIMGKTGSGKSTLLQLLLRFYDPDTGTISVNKQSITNADLLYFRSQIGYVPQDSFLFSDTISANISFGKIGCDRAAIEAATAAAAIDTEILQFPEGYQTLVGERGVTLSGGQKQRISLARALVSSPKLLLLDDSLSAIDSGTEQKIATYISARLVGTTVLMVSHRVPIHLIFDKVIVLEDGQIIEMGTPEFLLAKGGIYKKMTEYQQQ
jgi:ATP-binding cassette subfamily B protein